MTTATAGTTSDAIAGDVLFEQVYDRLKRIARRHLADDHGATLDTTALVHELYLRMATPRDGARAVPTHFFAYAARAMRNIVTDRARHRLTRKAGGDWLRVTVSALGGVAESETLAVDALALNDAIDRLAVEDARAAKVVELRYFGGLQVEQIAACLDLTTRTIGRDLDFARAYLRDVLG